ncbi:MAG: hypothetical protein JSS28_06055 [Proteobacteria bacterium]|nr:hypothetical protein [Pseudomonadota bacterium]
MYLQALLIRAAVAVTTGLVLTAAMLVDHGGHPAQAAIPAGIANAPRGTATEPVMLPTIHVRPTQAERIAASAPKPHPARLVIEVALPDLPAAASMPLRGLNIDMPYYSFGKALPRISKE